MAVNEIKTVLTLDDVSFAGKLNKAQSNLLKFSAVGATIGAITTAAAIATAKWNSELGNNAAKAGASVKEFSSLSVAAKKFGVETNDLTKAISTLNTATPEVEKKLKLLGITVRDASGFRQGSDVFLDLADKISKLKTPAEQSAMAMAALGEDGAKLLPLLSQGRDGFLSAQLAAQKYGLTVGDDAVKASEEFNRQTGEISMALQGATQALGNAAIEFANSTGAAQGLADAIAGVTRWFNDLSPSTQRVIMVIIGAAAAVATLTAALVAISAIAPAIGEAFKIMLGPVGLVIAGVAAVVGVVAYLAASNKTATQAADDFVNAQNKQIQKSKDLENTLSALSKKTQLNSEDQKTLAKAKQDLSAQAEALGKKLNVEAMSLRELTAAAKEFTTLTKEQSVKQLAEQIAEQKGVLAVQLQSLAQLARGGAESRAFIELRDAVVEREKAIKRLIAAKKELEEADKRPAAGGTRPPGEVMKAVAPEVLYKDDIRAALDEIDTAREKYALAQEFRDKKGSAAATEYARRLEELTNKQKQGQADATSNIQQTATAYAKAVDKIASKVGQVIGAISGITDAIASSSRYSAEVAARDAEIDAIRSARLYEEQKTALEKSYDDKLNALKNGEKNLTLAMENEISQRLLLADEEYQAEKARIEQAYADKLAAAELDYQMTLEKNARDAAFLEQKRLNESVINANWDAFKKAQELALQNELNAAAKGFADKQKNINAEGKTKIEMQSESSALEMQKIEDEKNAALASLDAARTEQTKAEEKRRLQIQYDAAMDEYNQTIAVKSAATIASGIAGAAQAFASLAAIPFIGLALGAAAAAVIMGATVASVANMNRQKPVKPAGLLAEKGGMVEGPRHSGGGVDINAEGGELIMPRDVTQAFLRTKAEESGGNRIDLSGNFNFYGAGSMDDFIDMLEEKLTGRILRTGAA